MGELPSQRQAIDARTCMRAAWQAGGQAGRQGATPVFMSSSAGDRCASSASRVVYPACNEPSGGQGKPSALQASEPERNVQSRDAWIAANCSAVAGAHSTRVLTPAAHLHQLGGCDIQALWGGLGGAGRLRSAVLPAAVEVEAQHLGDSVATAAQQRGRK